MGYTVQNIANNKGLRDFLDLPKEVYRNDSNWVAPLNSQVLKVLDQKRNPYFADASVQNFICYKSGVPVARASVVMKQTLRAMRNERVAQFGFFESANDGKATNLMFEKIEEYCKEQGVEYLEGPFNPNHYSELGLLVKNFKDPPAFFETYNPAYYSELLKDNGFKITKQLHTRINRSTDKFVNQQKKNTINKQGNDYSIRKFNLMNRWVDLEKIREINNDAFSDNWHFLPLSKEEYRFSSKYLFFVTRPSLVLIAEKGNMPVGVIQCVLNINKLLKPLNGRLSLLTYPKLLLDRRALNEIVIHAIGIKKEYQNSYVFKLIYDEMSKIVQRFPVVSTSWMTDDNIPAIHASDRLGLKPYKWFAVYGKHLT